MTTYRALLFVLFLLLPASAWAQVYVPPYDGASAELLQFGCNDAALANNQFMIQRSSAAVCPATATIANETLHLNYFRYTVRSMKCWLATTPTAGSTWTFTLQVAGVSSAISCTIANPATSCGPVNGGAVAVADSGVSLLWAETGGGIDGGTAQCNVLVEFQP